MTLMRFVCLFVLFMFLLEFNVVILYLHWFDQEVVEFCKSYLVANRDAFFDSRLELVINDARY